MFAKFSFEIHIVIARRFYGHGNEYLSTQLALRRVGFKAFYLFSKLPVTCAENCHAQKKWRCRHSVFFKG